MQFVLSALIAIVLSLSPAPAEAAHFDNPIFDGLPSGGPEIAQETSPPPPSPTLSPPAVLPSPPQPPALSGAVARRLACIRSFESDSAGGYRAVSRSGKFRGAYQATAEFWITYGGDPALAGRHEFAAPAEQDAVAARGLAARGLAPWPPARGRC